MADTNASDPLGLTDKPKDIIVRRRLYIYREKGDEKK